MWAHHGQKLQPQEHITCELAPGDLVDSELPMGVLANSELPVDELEAGSHQDCSPSASRPGRARIKRAHHRQPH